MNLPSGAVPDWPALVATVPSVILRRADPARIARDCRSRQMYLATPYTRVVQDENGAWCAERSGLAGLEAARWLARLAVLGVSAVSPILQAVEMVGSGVEPDLDPLDEDFWTRWCAPLLQASGGVIVPPLPGWDRSRGVWHEARAALSANQPVYLVEPGS